MLKTITLEYRDHHTFIQILATLIDNQPDGNQPQDPPERAAQSLQRHLGYSGRHLLITRLSDHACGTTPHEVPFIRRGVFDHLIDNFEQYSDGDIVDPRCIDEPYPAKYFVPRNCLSGLTLRNPVEILAANALSMMSFADLLASANDAGSDVRFRKLTGVNIGLGGQSEFAADFWVNIAGQYKKVSVSFHCEPESTDSIQLTGVSLCDTLDGVPLSPILKD